MYANWTVPHLPKTPVRVMARTRLVMQNNMPKIRLLSLHDFDEHMPACGNCWWVNVMRCDILSGKNATCDENIDKT